ncbi:MAG TPA: S1/P1 nuclease [Pyrinomonadaceae bacterium]
MMKRAWRVLILCAALFVPQAQVLAWHETGHMLAAQIAYLRLSPAAKAEVDRLLVAPADRRPLIHLCAGYYTRDTCEKIYDPVTIAVWMDDFRGDSLTDSYDNWHYINYRPIFDGTPERANVGPLPINVLDRLNWCINTLRTGTGSDKRDAEVLGFLYHLVGDVHQPLHAATRYSAKNPDGDAGGNFFTMQPPAGSKHKNLHSFWDNGAGLFGYDDLKRPLDAAGRARIRQLADDLMKKYPPTGDDWKQTDPQAWVIESNQIARTFAYVKTKEGEAPSAQYIEESRVIVGRRIALAGYRLAAVLDEILVRPPAPPRPR